MMEETKEKTKGILNMYTSGRRLVSLTTGNRRSVTVDFNKVIAITEPLPSDKYTTLHLEGGTILRVIEHYQRVHEKWVGSDELDNSIEGEDEL